MIIIQDHQKTPEMLQLAKLGPEYVEAAIVIEGYISRRLESRSITLDRFMISLGYPSRKVFNKVDFARGVAKWRKWLEHSNGSGNGEHKFISDELVPGTSVWIFIMRAVESLVNLETEK